jgi:flavin reductase (DIM6/NTAB) family NADH-FMN oxidoreductase RutF
VNRSPLRPFPLDRSFTFVESGPVLLIATAHGRRRNVMTVSCHASMGFEPSIGIMLGPWNHSYQALLETGECVVAIPGADLMEAAVDIGNCSGVEVDKFKRFGLTARKGTKIKAPLIAECLYNLECVVTEKPRPDGRELFVLQGVKAWRNSERKERRTFHAKGDGTFIIDGECVDLRDRMTKWQYCI